MFKEGMIYTGSPMDRISPGRLGLRKYDRSKAWPGYTLFSTGTYLAQVVPWGGEVPWATRTDR